MVADRSIQMAVIGNLITISSWIKEEEEEWKNKIDIFIILDSIMVT